MDMQNDVGAALHELIDLSNPNIEPTVEPNKEDATPQIPSEMSVQGILSDDLSRQLKAATDFRKMLLADDPPVDKVITSGVLPRLVELLGASDTKLQFETAWALTNIVSSKSEHVEAVVGAGAIPKLVELLSSTGLNVREQAVWALGNISGDSSHHRDLVLKSGALVPLLQILVNDSQPSSQRTASWTLSNFCRGRQPVPDWKLISPAVPTLINLVKSPDEETLASALWAISYLSQEHIEPFMSGETCPNLVALLRHGSTLIQKPALRAVGNIASGSRMQTRAIIDCGALPALLPLLSSPDSVIQKEACWTISNILADAVSSDVLQDAIDAGVIPPLIQLLKTSELKVKREACWALSNATSVASSSQIHYMAIQRLTEAFCDMLTITDEKIINVVLDGLDDILKAGNADAVTNNGLNPYTGDVERVGGSATIHGMRYHANTAIGRKASALIGRFRLSQHAPTRVNELQVHAAPHPSGFLPPITHPAPPQGSANGAAMDTLDLNTTNSQQDQDAMALDLPSVVLSNDITGSISLGNTTPIGYGGFGDLFLGIHKDHGKVALKKPRRMLDEALIRRFLREVDLWCSVSHPHILSCLGMCKVGLDVYVVSPFIENGDLLACMGRGMVLNHSKLLFEVAEALTHLHHRGIVHGDVKAQNILLSNDGSALLCDFGLAKAFDTMVTSTESKGAGSVRWMAPELCLGEARSMASDVYSLGITIAEVLSGRTPFHDIHDNLAVMFHIVYHDGRPPKDPLNGPEGVSYATFWETAEKCWVKEAKGRPHMAQVLGMLFPLTRGIV